MSQASRAVPTYGYLPPLLPRTAAWYQPSHTTQLGGQASKTGGKDDGENFL